MAAAIEKLTSHRARTRSDKLLPKTPLTAENQHRAPAAAVAAGVPAMVDAIRSGLRRMECSKIVKMVHCYGLALKERTMENK